MAELFLAKFDHLPRHLDLYKLKVSCQFPSVDPRHQGNPPGFFWAEGSEGPEEPFKQIQA